MNIQELKEVQSIKKNKNLIAITVVILVIFGALYIVLNGWLNTEGTSVSSVQRSIITEIDKTLFGKKGFMELMKFNNNIPLKIEQNEVSRDNPFIDYRNR